MNGPNGSVYPPPGLVYNGAPYPPVYPNPQFSAHPPHPELPPTPAYLGHHNHRPPALGPPHLVYSTYPPPWFRPHPQQLPPNPPPPAPLHPPGLKLPSHIAEEHKVDPSCIHEYWRGRLAPLPGFKSSSELPPMRDVKRFKMSIRQPAEEKRLHLLPPYSFYGPSYKGDTSAPTSPTNIQPNHSEKTEKSLDIFAESFIPQYLIDVQTRPYSLAPLDPIPVFPPLTYLQSYLIPPIIEEYRSTNPHALLSAPPQPPHFKHPPLDSSTYHRHWSTLLRWELDVMASQTEQVVLWSIHAKVVNWDQAEFVLYVPRIREGVPRVDLGDLVHLRQVAEADHQDAAVAFEGRVCALRKREGLVHFHSSALRSHLQMYAPLGPTSKVEGGYISFDPGDTIPFTFNVTFILNARPFCLMESAVSAVSKLLGASSSIPTFAQHWLFPEQEHDLPPIQVSEVKDIQSSQWVDKGLNTEQRLAVTTIGLYQSSVPHLISGPPGTGKTRTVVEAILQIFRVQPQSCILVCAPSNSATDTLALRLKKQLKQEDMLRLNDPNRTFAEVPDSLKPYCYVEDDRFALPPWKTLMKYRVIVCSCQDAGILAAAQCTNQALMTMENEIITSIHPHKLPAAVAQLHWTHLLIDEAAQGSEPELLVPISVVLPPIDSDSSHLISPPQLTLCGDIHQLGPIIASEQARSAELDVSLLERLVERPLYAAYRDLIVEQQREGHVHTFRRVPPLTRLIKNYRSHPVILMPPSALFYDDSLRPHANNGFIHWDKLPNPNLPLKFIGTTSEEMSLDEKASWFNLGEIERVVDVVKSLLADRHLSNPPLRPEQIGIMAPWREQVWQLRRVLRAEGFSAVDVGNVEDYQGRENRVIIISCVRTNPRFLEEDARKGLGLMFEKKRMNVAITRARELLVVVGCGNLLQKDPYWNGFLQFALRHKLYDGPELSLEMDGNYISRLESTLLHSQDDPEVDAEQQGLAVAGGVAREVLRE